MLSVILRRITKSTVQVIQPWGVGCCPDSSRTPLQRLPTKSIASRRLTSTQRGRGQRHPSSMLHVCLLSRARLFAPSRIGVGNRLDSRPRTRPKTRAVLAAVRYSGKNPIPESRLEGKPAPASQNVGAAMAGTTLLRTFSHSYTRSRMVQPTQQLDAFDNRREPSCDRSTATSDLEHRSGAVPYRAPIAERFAAMKRPPCFPNILQPPWCISVEEGPRSTERR